MVERALGAIIGLVALAMVAGCDGADGGSATLTPSPTPTLAEIADLAAGALEVAASDLDRLAFERWRNDWEWIEGKKDSTLASSARRLASRLSDRKPCAELREELKYLGGSAEWETAEAAQLKNSHYGSDAAVDHINRWVAAIRATYAIARDAIGTLCSFP